MAKVCLNIPDTIIEAIDNLVEFGLFVNRSEAIRYLISQGLVIVYRSLVAENPSETLIQKGAFKK